MTQPGAEAPGDVFDITVERGAEAPVVFLRGEVDVATAPEVREELHRLLDGGATHVVLDVGDMSFIDSSGLGVLVGALRRAREAGGRLEIVNVQPATRRVFDVTGLTEAFGIV